MGRGNVGGECTLLVCQMTRLARMETIIFDRATQYYGNQIKKVKSHRVRVLHSFCALSIIDHLLCVLTIFCVY